MSVSSVPQGTSAAKFPSGTAPRGASEQGMDGQGSFSELALGRLQVAPGKREDIFRCAPRRRSVL